VSGSRSEAARWLAFCFLKNAGAFPDLRVVPRRHANGTREGSSNRGVCQKRAWIQCRGLIVPQVSRGAISKRRRQRPVDGRLKFQDRWRSFARFLWIECFEFSDTLLKALNAASLLPDCQDRRFRLGRWSGTTGHANLWISAFKAATPSSVVRNASLSLLQNEC
jgi:hypothetical protein